MSPLRMTKVLKTIISSGTRSPSCEAKKRLLSTTAEIIFYVRHEYKRKKFAWNSSQKFIQSLFLTVPLSRKHSFLIRKCKLSNLWTKLSFQSLLIFVRSPSSHRSLLIKRRKVIDFFSTINRFIFFLFPASRFNEFSIPSSKKIDKAKSYFQLTVMKEPKTRKTLNFLQ